MSFTPQTFSELQSLLATQYAAQANLPANTDEGSTLGSVFNAIAMMALQQQTGLTYVEQISRLATSSGPDVDTFVQPFGITRLGAAASSGTVTFSTSSPTSQQLVIAVGTIVQTTSGLQFTVIADNTQPGYNATLNGYVINAGQSSVSATVTCLVAGAIGNVQPGQINQIYGGPGGQPVVGVTNVTNAAAFTSGRDQETDAQLKSRFTLALSSGRVSTSNALAAAVLGVQPGLTYSIGDQLNTSGAAAIGYATVVVNELGTGTTAPSSLISAVQSAVNAVRSAGVTSTVIGPTLVTVNVAATLHIPTSYTAANVVSAATSALQAYINNIGLDPAGASTILGYIDVGVVLRGVTGVSRVDSLSVNSGTADLTATFAQQFSAGTITLTAVQP